MPSPFRTALSALALLALLVACGEGPTGGDHDLQAREFANAPPQQVPAEFRALLPDDTLVYLQARSLAALAHDLGTLGGEQRLPGPPSRVQLMSVLPLFDPAGALRVDDLAPDAPVALALRWPTDSLAPQWMSLFFRADDTDFEARLGDAFQLVREGRAVRATPRADGDAAPASGAAPLPDALAAGQLSLWADLRATFEHPGVRSVLEAGAAGIAMNLAMQQAAAPDMTPLRDLLDLQLLLARESLDEFARLDLGARASAGVLQFRGELTLRDGSALGDFDALDTRGLRRVAGLLDPDATIRWLVLADFAQVRARSAPLLQRIAERDEALAETFGALLGLSASMGGAQATEFSGLGDMRVRSYLAAERPGALEALLASVPQTGALLGGITYSEPERRRIDGVEVTSLRIDDLGPAAAGLPQAPVFAGITERTTSYFEHDGLVVTLQGDDVDAEVRAAIAAIDDAPAAPDEFASALERFEGTGMALAMRMRLGVMIRRLTADLGAPPPPSDEDPEVSLFVGNEGSRWSFDISVDAASMDRMIRR